MGDPAEPAPPPDPPSGDPSAGAAASKATFVKERLQSLDAYRGLIMLSLAFSGFRLYQTAPNFLEKSPDSGFWKAVLYEFSHTAWVGCSYWDMIQPSFMFMVGMSMAYSYVRRQREGQPYTRMLRHAVSRSLILIWLGVFLSSNWSSSTHWVFMNVLSQIGLGYTFLFLLWGRTPRTQAVTAAALLVGTWLLYVLYPTSGIPVDTGAEELGVSAAWAGEHLRDVGAAWHKNANVGHAIDTWFLNLFPGKEPFVFNKGGYQTINFIPELATMIFGLMCGELIRSKRGPMEKVRILVIAGMAGLAAGEVIHLVGICPIVKRIWTPSWTLLSTGGCCLILAALYYIIDVRGFRKWSGPLVIVGMNSIAMYFMGQLLKSWTAKTLQTHLGRGLFDILGTAWSPTVQAILVGCCFWAVCWYLYRKKIFIRI